MFDLDKIITGLKTDPGTQKTALTGLAGLAAGMLLSGGKPGKMIGNTVKLGAAAAIGGLAWQAWQNYQATQGNAPAPSRDEFIPGPNPQAPDPAFMRALVRAMIAATKADGKTDETERAAIFGKLETLNLSAADMSFVFDELSAPLDLDTVAAGAQTPAQAADLYAASLVAITADTVEERAYLQALSAKLSLPPALVDEIHKAV